MCVLGLMLGIVAIVGVMEGRSMLDQTLKRDLAATVAKDLQPSILTSLNKEVVQQKFATFQRYNPISQLFLLDANGRILLASPSSFEVKLENIDTTPIKEFLSADWSSPQRIVAQDPRAPKENRTFSATDIIIEGSPGYLYVVYSRPEFQTQLNQKIVQLLFGAGVISLLFGLFGILVVGLVLFFFVTRRFRRLRKVVHEFEEGDYSARYQGNALDEVSKLGLAFNQMAEAIQNSVNELEQSSEQRRALVANVSHDLRTPLTNMQGYLEMILLEHKETLSPEVLKFLNIIHEEVESLGVLVRELFELSRYDAKEFTPQCEAFSAATLAEDVAQKLQPLAQEKFITLTADAPEDTPYIFADFSMIDRVITNLAVNALHATPPKGTVEIQVADLNDSVSISVNILELHGEEITVTSELDKGSCFQFTLPRYRVSSASTS
jgi:signal transduction histidine kinase